MIHRQIFSRKSFLAEKWGSFFQRVGCWKCMKQEKQGYNKEKKGSYRKEGGQDMKGDFLRCGAAGWCLEIFWTGLHAVGRKEWKMMGQSSLWMFPIYGMAACIGPISRSLKKIPVVLRGSLYMTGIFAAEFSTGLLLKRYDMCPWDYSSYPLNYKGVIRLDYAPLWFCTGLLFEKILSHDD